MKLLKPSLCLTMIVKNESRIIERCLNSAKPVIGFVSICDTGSTDNTPALIQAWCEHNGLPGKIHHEPFRDFGYNRTRAVELAQASFPESRYLLLLDADMILEVGDDFDAGKLTADSYSITQYSRFIRYSNTRLLKTSGRWNCVGVTHEYWDAVGGATQQNHSLSSLTINDREDGGSKADKFIRDRNLLTAGYNDPATPEYLKTRYSFYLGQTYFDLGQYLKAIRWYEERVRRGGWAEEVFYALYKIGQCQLRQGNKEFAIAALTRAWEYRPARAEALYLIAKTYREQNQHHSALIYALKGRQIPMSPDSLFVEYGVYDYGFDYEISISAYYVEGLKSLGSAASDKLLGIIDRLPEDIADSVRRNSRFYRDAAPTDLPTDAMPAKNPATSKATPYDEKFYEAISTGSLNSALAVFPLVFDLYQPESIIDLGCGIGAWLNAAVQLGVSDILGIDGSYVDRKQLLIPTDRFVETDLSAVCAKDLEVRIGRRFDLAISLEVAEHLPAASAPGLVDALCMLAPVVLFSAAVPHQGGTHHINEQFPSYWSPYFRRNGYLAIDVLRRAIWHNENVEWWYRQNLLIFATPQAIAAHPSLAKARADTQDNALDLIHPAHYQRVANWALGAGK